MSTQSVSPRSWLARSGLTLFLIAGVGILAYEARTLTVAAKPETAGSPPVNRTAPNGQTVPPLPPLPTLVPLWQPPAEDAQPLADPYVPLPDLASLRAVDMPQQGIVQLKPPEVREVITAPIAPAQTAVQDEPDPSDKGGGGGGGSSSSSSK